MGQRLLLAFAVACLAGDVQAGKASHSWKTYINARFGYSLCYPADALHPGREPDMHDGVVFKGPQGSQLAVSGDLGAGEFSVTETAEMEAAPGTKISSRAHGRGWAVISGATPKGLVYVRAQTSGDQEVNYVLTYSPNLKVLYSPIIPKLNRCFRFGRLSY